MSDITDKLTSPEPVELNETELDYVCGGTHRQGHGFGPIQAVERDPDPAPESVLTPRYIIIVGQGPVPRGND